MILLKCCRGDCRYVWEYNGNHRYKTNCPKCMTCVAINKNRTKCSGDLCGKQKT